MITKTTNEDPLNKPAQEQDRKRIVLDILARPEVRLNLLIMCIVWTTASSNTYLLYFLVNTFERQNVTALFFTLADIIAYVLSSTIVEKFSAKQTLVASFGVATIGGLLTLTYGLDHQDSIAFSAFVFLSRFGMSCAYGTVFYGNSKIFPEEVQATTIGVCSVVARIFCACQILFSQLEQPTPMLIFTISSAVTAILCFFIQEKDRVSTVDATEKD